MDNLQIYARVKRTSKYFCQNTWHDTVPFPVTLKGDPCDYCVYSKLNRYRLRDISLFVKDHNGKTYRLG